MRTMFKSILMLLLITSLSFAQSKKIAYTSNQSSNGLLQIFTMNEDGSSKQQVTTLDANCLFPKWANDGTKITFSTDDDKVYYVSSEDNFFNVHFVWGGNNPIFSGTDEEIIFTSEYEGVLSVYIMGLDETEPYMMSDGHYANQMRLSPDGSKMIYSSILETNKTAMLLDLDDTTDTSLRPVSKNSDANLEPDIALDNSTFVYAGFDNNLKGTIYINLNGNEKSLTRDMASATQPKFSPDGKKIGFALIRNGEHVSLYTMSTDGSSRKEIFIKGGELGLFEWVSNDKILYDAENGTEYNVGIVDLGTGVATILTNNGLNLHADMQK
ncbi:hypothetical protein BH10BAC5_BH10BAC5_12220 [soil metagenome]